MDKKLWFSSLRVLDDALVYYLLLEEIHENFINIVVNYSTFKFGNISVGGFYFPET